MRRFLRYSLEKQRKIRGVLMLDGQLVQRTLLAALSSNRASDRMQVKTRVRDELSRFLFQKTGRNPMILPVIMDV
jgi:ribonuclease J